MAVLNLAGCSGRSSGNSGSILSPEFFSSEITGIITVWAYDSLSYKNFLEEAARSFEALYPGTKVNVETFQAMPVIRTGEQGNNQMLMVELQNDPQSRADYISRVNTNLMSGTGADIYAMDILPLYIYAENGTLENLDSYILMDPAFNRNDYRENILDAIRFKNGTWFLPLDYDFNYFTYDTTLIPADYRNTFGIDKAVNAEDLLKIGTVLYDGTYKVFSISDFSRGPVSMFNILMAENIQSFLNLETKKPNFIDGSFTAMLNSIKNNSTLGLIPQGVTGQQDAGQQRQQYSRISTERYFFKQYNAINLLSRFAGKAGITVRLAEGGMAAGIDSDDEIAGIEANTDGLIPFTFNQGFGINSQTKNKAAAWAFLKHLLSREMQLSTAIITMGLPINNHARYEKAELIISSRTGSVTAMNEQLLQALNEYRATVEALSDSINTFVMQDSNINDMIAQEAGYFFSNSRNADDVASVIQNKVDLYLSE